MKYDSFQNLFRGSTMLLVSLSSWQHVKVLKPQCHVLWDASCNSCITNMDTLSFSCGNNGLSRCLYISILVCFSTHTSTSSPPFTWFLNIHSPRLSLRSSHTNKCNFYYLFLQHLSFFCMKFVWFGINLHIYLIICVLMVVRWLETILYGDCIV